MFATLSMERRPEVRNSAVRTMFLATGTHVKRLVQSPGAMRTCFNDCMLAVVKICDIRAGTSSDVAEAAVELGKEKGCAAGRALEAAAGGCTCGGRRPAVPERRASR
jgi:hypothetical protein